MATMEQVNRYRELLPYLWACTVPKCDGLPHQGFPHKHARASQRVEEHLITAWITGRGYGKTKSAAEYVKTRMLSEPKHRVNLVAPTFGVGRDVCLEGESGIIACLPPDRIANYNRSLGEIVLRNGSQLKLFGAHTSIDAESIRGSQSHTFWGEEVAQWRHQMLAYDMATLANRLGSDPRTVITATPKPTPLIRKLIALAKNEPNVCRLVTGSTWENAANLAVPFLDHLKRTYVGTRLEIQEIEGLLLDDVVGALWNREMIRYASAPLDLVRVVAGVDPPGSHKNGALCGIVVVGKDVSGILYVLADLSFTATPEQWAARVVEAYDEFQADCVCVEGNYGGDMAISTLRTYSEHPKVKKVTATRGKQLRAEPAVNLYERAKVFHVEPFQELETQQCSWVPPGQVETDENGIELPIPASSYSPDRVDALVWAITELALQPRRPTTTMRCVVRSF